MSSTSLFPLPPGGLSAPAAATINHLLVQEAWARASLQRHAGKTACIDLGAARVCLRVTADGMLDAPGDDAPADALSDALPAVTIHVKPGDVPLILQNQERAFSYVRIEGDAEFANTISQLSKGLRWDAEYDLERVVGPIAARRLVGGARGIADGAATAGRRFAENVAEFLLEEKRVLVRPGSVDGFAADVGRLRDDVERAAKRMAKLEQRLAQRPATASSSLPATPASSTTAVVPAPSHAVVAPPAPSSDTTPDA